MEVFIILLLITMYKKQIAKKNRMRRDELRKTFLRKLKIQRRKRLTNRQRLVQLLITSTKRSCWCIHRSRQWWQAASNGLFGNKWWKENLRMSYETFNLLVKELKPSVERRDTTLRRAVPVEERVAVTIWRLATNVEYRTLAALFGLGRSTVGEIVIDTCKAISDNLFSNFVRIPSGNQLQAIVEGFETRWGFPQVAGAIDGSHIPIVRPCESASDYFNRKGYYSIIIQGVVDYRGKFIDAYIGWPGKLHDARVFYNSSFYRKANSGILFPNWSRCLYETDVPLIILGDPAYPLLPWLMKPYSETTNITPEEKHYNYWQSRARMVVENAFGRLKGRWRCLLKRLDYNLCNVPVVVASCVTLHNICEEFGDHCLEEWVQTNENQHPPSSSNQTNTSTNTTASDVRQVLTKYVNEH